MPSPAKSAPLDRPVLTLRGDIALIDVQDLPHHLKGVASGEPRAVLDLDQVRSIELSAIDRLVDVAESLRRLGVDVSVTPSWADEAFRLTGRWSKG